MFEFLNKIFGSLAALILYPIKSVLVSLGLVLLYLMLIPIFVIGLPILLATLFAALVYENSGLGALITALFTFAISGLLSIVFFPLLFAATIIYTIYQGIFDFFRAARFGIQDGYEQGLFFHVLNRFLFDIVIFSSGLQRQIAQLSQLSQLLLNEDNGHVINALNEQDDLADYFDLADVPHSSLEQIPELHEQPKPQKVAFQPLSIDELQQAKGISDLIGGGKIVSAYESLHQRLTELNADLATRGKNEDLGLENVMDEVMFVEIKEPALLVKQYKDENGKWRVIPDRTKIIDKPQFEKWLSQKNAHPETREKMNDANPEVIDEISRETRYRIHPYTNMNSSQELIEASRLIRRKLNELSPANQVGQLASGLRVRFFENAEAQNSAHNESGALLKSSM